MIIQTIPIGNPMNPPVAAIVVGETLTMAPTIPMMKPAMLPIIAAPKTPPNDQPPDTNRARQGWLKFLHRHPRAKSSLLIHYC